MISVVFDGRLGNQLFQYCVCRSIAERNHYDFHIPKITHQGTKSSLDNNFVKCDMGLPSCTWRSVYTETDNQPYNEKIFDINDYTLLFGFFQSEKYFKHNREKILSDWFVFNESFLDKPYDFEKTCFIHHRSGDYTHSPYYLPLSYYEHAINLMRTSHNIDHFIIITEDVEKCRAVFGNKYEMQNNTPENDFLVFKKCKYSIIANSTFSWWGIWLNTNKVKIIAPKLWLNYNHFFYEDDIWRPNDVEMEDNAVLYIRT